MKIRYPSIALAVAIALTGCHSSPVLKHGPATTRATSQPLSLHDQLSEILNRKADTGAIVAARVIDLDTGEEIYAQNIDRPTTPASNMKLTVTAASLDFFGADAEFKTDFAISNAGDLYVIGHGDPGLGDDEIEAKYGRTPYAPIDAWADELIAMEKTSFPGNIYYVDDAFDAEVTHPTWKGELNEWYAAPITGLNYNDNCVDAIATPDKAGGPPHMQFIPETSNTITVKNEATSKADGKNDVEWDRDQLQNVYTITGNATKVTKFGSRPVTDPGAMFADAIQTRFAKKGITINGQVKRAMTSDVPADATKLTPAMTKLSDVLWRILKPSQNTLADAIAKKLGLESSLNTNHEPGSWHGADLAFREFCKKSNIDTSALVFADGSGLSVDNRVTIRMISDLLVTMSKRKDFDLWRASLPNAGVDGTMKDRLKDVPNRVFAKTGFISHVRSLSGYAKSDSGKWYVFSIIYNEIPRPRRAAGETVRGAAG